MTQTCRVVFGIAAAAIIGIVFLRMKNPWATPGESLTAEDITSTKIDQLQQVVAYLSLSLKKMGLDNHSDGISQDKVILDDQNDYRSKDKDQIVQRIDELRASLDRLWCKTQKIGSTGGFCLTEENIRVGANHKWDIKLCRALEELFGNSAVVDLGAGLGHYGKCFLRKNESIFITKEKKIAARIHADYLQKMGDLINEPQVIKSWNGYDGAINVGHLSKGFIKQQDLSVENLWLGRTWDWVISLEVGEHVPALYEDILIDNLARHSCKGMVISWALVKQGGHHHVNGQNNWYIKQKMADRGLLNDIKAEKLLRETVVTDYFKNTLMVFRYPEGYRGRGC